MFSRRGTIAVLLALALVVSAATLAQAGSTQFNVAPGNFVTLRFNSSTGQFVRIDQQANNKGAFTVPSGQSLVVTDVAWVFNSTNPSGSTEVLQLNITRSGNDQKVFVATTVVNTDGSGGLNQHLTGGLVVSGGGSAAVVPHFPSDVDPTSVVLILQGFLS